MLADAVKVRTSHLTVQIISWVAFRTNLNRQRPRIASVGEVAIAQLLILHAEAVGAAAWGLDEPTGLFRQQ